MNNLSSLISCALIWILFFWFWRDYRLNRFRQTLFELRDDLFDLARSGKIDYSHPAYVMLRNTINGTIQFGHKFGILDFIALAVAAPKNQLEVTSLRKELDEACSELDQSTKEAIQAIYDKMHIRVIEQVVLTSFILSSATALFAGLILMNSVKKALLRQMYRLIHKPRLASVLAQFDRAALMRGSPI
ncbi:hypothetical protein GC163_10940 [bacterium]|nr:hypothetical protein [bacterium]